MCIIELRNIKKVYGAGENAVTALQNINLKIERGDFFSVMGPSGSGKSTLLNILGCMDVPTEGEMLVYGKNTAKVNNRGMSRIRGNTVGFIFQNFALLPEYSVYENICLPLNCRKMSARERRERIYDVMEKLHIDNLAKKKPTQISGGQQQRVAIARALVTGNELLLADEPTGALDQRTGMELLELLSDINEEGKSIVLVTHDDKVASYARQRIYIEDGKMQMSAAEG